jgi:hypothetical protein
MYLATKQIQFQIRSEEVSRLVKWKAKALRVGPLQSDWQGSSIRVMSVAYLRNRKDFLLPVGRPAHLIMSGNVEHLIGRYLEFV